MDIQGSKRIPGCREALAAHGEAQRLGEALQESQRAAELLMNQVAEAHARVQVYTKPAALPGQSVQFFFTTFVSVPGFEASVAYGAVRAWSHEQSSC